MFTQKFASYVCQGDTIQCELEGFTCIARIYRDDSNDKPDQRDDGFWPSKDKTAAGYVLPENFEAEYAKAENVMRGWKNDEWFYCGVGVTIHKAGVQLTGQFDHALWGVECNYPGSDNDYLREVANDSLQEALAAAKAKLAELTKQES